MAAPIVSHVRCSASKTVPTTLKPAIDNAKGKMQQAAHASIANAAAPSADQPSNRFEPSMEFRKLIILTSLPSLLSG